jgi:hypothetical protein
MDDARRKGEKTLDRSGRQKGQIYAKGQNGGGDVRIVHRIVRAAARVLDAVNLFCIGALVSLVRKGKSTSLPAVPWTPPFAPDRHGYYRCAKKSVCCCIHIVAGAEESVQ